MNQLQVFNYNDAPIQFEVIDGRVMANATLMCQAFGRNTNDIFKTKAWKDFESAVCEDLNTRYEDIRYARQGGVSGEQGTWIHEELVLELARRLDARFALWCNRKVSELLKTGTVAINQPQNDDDILSRAVLIAQSRIQRLETENTLLLEKNTGLIKTVEQQAPKVEYVDAVLNSDGCMNTTEIAAEFSWSARRLNAELEKLGVQYKTNGHWVLTHKYKDIEQRTGHKYTETRTILKENPTTGNVSSHVDRLWTQRGRALIWWIIRQDREMKQKAFGQLQLN